MKIIFLDIDGVLNVNYPKRDEYGALFHPHLVENLKLIIDSTAAKIVITSSWRKSGLEAMQAMWKFRNLPGEVIDLTPSIYVFRGTNNIIFWNGKRERKPTPKFRGYTIPRGCEIEYWLLDQPKQPESFVILDDDTDMLLSQADHYVQCSGNTDHEDHVDGGGYGLTKQCAEKAIQILNKNDHRKSNCAKKPTPC